MSSNVTVDRFWWTHEIKDGYTALYANMSGISCLSATYYTKGPHITLTQRGVTDSSMSQTYWGGGTNYQFYFFPAIRMYKYNHPAGDTGYNFPDVFVMPDWANEGYDVQEELLQLDSNTNTYDIRMWPIFINYYYGSTAGFPGETASQSSSGNVFSTQATYTEYFLATGETRDVFALSPTPVGDDYGQTSIYTPVIYSLYLGADDPYGISLSSAIGNFVGAATYYNTVNSNSTRHLIFNYLSGQNPETVTYNEQYDYYRFEIDDHPPVAMPQWYWDAPAHADEALLFPVIFYEHATNGDRIWKVISDDEQYIGNTSDTVASIGGYGIDLDRGDPSPAPEDDTNGKKWELPPDKTTEEQFFAGDGEARIHRLNIHNPTDIPVTGYIKVREGSKKITVTLRKFTIRPGKAFKFAVALFHDDLLIVSGVHEHGETIELDVTWW